MNEMISQCPKCMTSFKVTDEQLQIAAGQVRCGYCMNVFMGRDYLISGGEGGDAADEDVLRTLLEPMETQDAEEDVFADADLFNEHSSEMVEARQFDGIVSADGDDLEPDIHMLEENLKFDEGDLRTSTDEDWALALLAELDQPSQSTSELGDQAENTETAEASTSESWDPLREMLEPSAAAPEVLPAETAPPAPQSKPGFGFEEIVVDVVPSSNDDADELDLEKTLTPDAGQPENVSGELAVDEAFAEEDSEVEFQLAPEIDAIKSATLIGEADTSDGSSIGESVNPGANVWGVEEQGGVSEYSSLSDVLKDDDEPAEAMSAAGESDSEANLYEDASSVYAPSAEPSPASDEEGDALVDFSSPAAEIERREDIFGEDTERRRTDFLPQHIDLEAEHVALPEEPQPIQWRWLAAAVGMVALLCLQYSYFYWGDLIASSKTRPMLASVCNVVGCELPPFRDLNNIKVDKHVMRVHADVDSAMTVDIIIRNKATLPQPFPVLQLTFSDMNNLPIATRKFFPNEYLDGELRGLSSMPTGSPVRLSLHVMEPGAEATNYALNLLPSL